MSQIDPDDQSTWPEPVREWVQGWAEKDIASGALQVGLMEHEGDLRTLLADHKVLTYHCTRLLDHELNLVQTQGLRKLTPELVLDRLRMTREAGALTVDQHDALAESHAADEEYRHGQVCLVLGRSSFDTDPGASANLFEIWGGEAISFPADSTPLEYNVLRRIGHPAIIACNIAISEKTQTFGELAVTFVNSLRGEPGYSVVHAMDDVPAEDIHAIWQPGHLEYDKHANLPR